MDQYLFPLLLSSLLLPFPLYLLRTFTRPCVATEAYDSKFELILAKALFLA